MLDDKVDWDGDEMEKVKLFTKQNEKTLSQLERNGRFVNNRTYVELHLGDIAPYFVTKYDWLTRQAARWLPKPDDVRAPIWCAVSPRSCMRPEEGSLVYCLEVPRDKIIFFDNFKWDYVLNQLYLPKDEQDAQDYKRHLESIGVKSRFDFSKDRYRNLFPDEIRRIEESWIRIFELEEWNIWNVCANIWEIRQEWVTDIIRFGEEVDVPALEVCSEGVVLYDTWPSDYQPLPLDDVLNAASAEKAGAPRASGVAGTRGSMVSVGQFRERLVIK